MGEGDPAFVSGHDNQRLTTTTTELWSNVIGYTAPPQMMSSGPEEVLSPHNPVGSDIEALLMNPRLDLNPLLVKEGTSASPIITISPQSARNFTTCRKKGH